MQGGGFVFGNSDFDVTVDDNYFSDITLTDNTSALTGTLSEPASNGKRTATINGVAGTFNLNYKKHAEVMPHGCVSFADKIRYIRNAGVTGRILAVEGISSVQKLQEVIDAGADGAIIGNALMNLWDDEARLWPFFDSLVACAGGQGGFGKE